MLALVRGRTSEFVAPWVADARDRAADALDEALFETKLVREAEYLEGMLKLVHTKRARSYEVFVRGVGSV